MSGGNGSINKHIYKQKMLLNIGVEVKFLQINISKTKIIKMTYRVHGNFVVRLNIWCIFV